MNPSNKSVLLSLLLSVGTLTTQADQTNVVQNLNIQLWGVQSSTSASGRNLVTSGFSQAALNTRRIIQALGSATGNSFANRAKLVVVTPLGGGDASIQVRDGTSQVDVTAFFTHDQTSGSVSGSVTNSRSGKGVDLAFSVQHFALKDANGDSLGLHFDVSGFATETSAGSVGGVDNLRMSAAGSGDSSGNLMILQGGIEVDGGSLEVIPTVVGFGA